MGSMDYYKVSKYTRPIIGRSLRIVCIKFCILSPCNNPLNPWKLIKAHGSFWKLLNSSWKFYTVLEAYRTIRNPLEAIGTTKFKRCDTHRATETDWCIELGFAQLNMKTLHVSVNFLTLWIATRRNRRSLIFSQFVFSTMKWPTGGPGGGCVTAVMA